MDARTEDQPRHDKAALASKDQSLPSQRSTIHKIFIGADGLRAGWSILIFIALFAIFISAATAIIGPDGIAQVTATANSISGSYTVDVAAAGTASPASFTLKNLVALTFSEIVFQSIPFGTVSASTTNIRRRKP